jgi:hypothetical protein
VTAQVVGLRRAAQRPRPRVSAKLNLAAILVYIFVPAAAFIRAHADHAWETCGKDAFFFCACSDKNHVALCGNLTSMP